MCLLGGRYHCEGECGFASLSYEAVCKHEMTCPKCQHSAAEVISKAAPPSLVVSAEGLGKLGNVPVIMAPMPTTTPVRPSVTASMSTTNQSPTERASVTPPLGLSPVERLQEADKRRNVDISTSQLTSQLTGGSPAPRWVSSHVPVLAGAACAVDTVQGDRPSAMATQLHEEKLGRRGPRSSWVTRLESEMSDHLRPKCRLLRIQCKAGV
jgi:hypothetical protein